MPMIEPHHRIYELRKEQGLKQKDLAAKMNITDGTIAKLETGRMVLTVPYLLQIARALGVDPIDILEPGTRGIRARYIAKISLEQARQWEAHAPAAEPTVVVPGNLRGANLFAVDAVGEVVLPFDTKAGALIVDPDSKDLIAGKLYLVADGLALPCVRKLVTEPSLTLAPVAPGGDPVKIGETLFMIIGRVVYASFEL